MMHHHVPMMAVSIIPFPIYSNDWDTHIASLISLKLIVNTVNGFNIEIGLAITTTFVNCYWKPMPCPCHDILKAKWWPYPASSLLFTTLLDDLQAADFLSV
jgi:hypothetical protein